ncbi:MAG: hypothetical protein JNL21_12170 [Myxococcales bacterium]|nr:hypothetical protein [Myxococcales bacterium]
MTRPLSWRALAIVATLAASILACSDDEGTTSTTTSSSTGAPTCTLPFIGDQTKSPELELFYYGADQMDHPLTEGGGIDIIEPPQGGRVLFVGVRATNVDPCGVTLTGALRDPATTLVRFDTRNFNLKDDGAGYGRSAEGDIASYANIPVCHNTWLETDIYGSTFSLEVTLKDKRGLESMKTISVVPACAEPGDKQVQCECICKGGYTLGEACGAGGGGGGVGGGG